MYRVLQLFATGCYFLQKSLFPSQQAYILRPKVQPINLHVLLLVSSLRRYSQFDGAGKLSCSRAMAPEVYPKSTVGAVACPQNNTYSLISKWLIPELPTFQSPPYCIPGICIARTQRNQPVCH